MLAALALASVAVAHDMYLMPASFLVKPGMTITVRLQNGDSFPESEASPVLARVRDMKLISADGATDAVNMHTGDKAVEGDFRVPGSGSVVVARTIPFAFRLGAKEFNAYLQEEGLEATQQWRAERYESEAPGRERYGKYAKTLLTTGTGNEVHTRPANLVFEIVPAKSPYELKAGESLRIKLLLRGRPAGNIQAEASHARPGEKTKTTIIGRTDNNGEISVPALGSGLWRIHAVTMERCPDTAVADWESSWASLTFELP